MCINVQVVSLYCCLLVSTDISENRTDNGIVTSLAMGPSNDRRTPQDAADRHRTLFLVIFWVPLRSRQQLTMI